MRHLAAVVLSASMVAACVGELPPAPELKVTSPERGLVQGGAGQVVVKGTTGPNIDGDRVVRVVVNDTPATLAADGSFTATVDVPAGATLLQTTAYTGNGGQANDARAVQIGELRAVGSNVDRAVTATLSTAAFARLSAAAGPLLKTLDLPTMLAPQNPMAKYGDSLAFVNLSVSGIQMGDIRISLTPTDAGLAFSAEVDTVAVGAKADYDGTFVPKGSTTVKMKTDKITLTGTLDVASVGNAGFTTTITTPRFLATNMKLEASGLVGSIAELIYDNMSGTIQKMMSKAIEGALAPMITKAFGALAGPQHLDVLGKQLDLEATPSAVTFTNAGALVTINLATKIAGSEGSPGFIYTPNGTPTLDVSNGVQLALSDDLVNNMLAQIHQLGMLNLHIEEDFSLVDTVDLKLAMPPMVSANTTDGSLRLVIGDMIANFSKDGETVIGAAVNAQVDLQIIRGNSPEEIGLEFGDIRVWVNPLEGTDEGYDLKGFASDGIGLQRDSLKPFLVKVPLPTVAGVTFDNLAMHADSGYVVMSGNIH